MNAIIKTGLAILLLGTSCKKENNTIQSSDVGNKSAASNITDITDGYASVRIGTQRWMTTNLSVTHYRNGDRIPQVKDPHKWATLTTGAWCWYNNNSDTGAVYGRLYNWYAVNDPRGLAPIGWHIPGDAEWNTLSAFLGGDAVAGGKMKEIGTTHWAPPNYGATNSSGFTGLPGGYRFNDGTFYNINYYGFWWSSTENLSDGAWYRDLLYGNSNLAKFSYYKESGLSIRCVKD
jgi:uncharacterized protein (TIGR02145 family)